MKKIFGRESMTKYSFLQSVFLVSPLLLMLIVFYLYPLLSLFPASVVKSGQFTWEHYEHFFSISLYSDVLFRTMRIGLVVAGLCLVIGYPVAYFLADLRGSIAAILLTVFVLLPFWTSVLVKSYSWVVLFQTNGTINQFLLSTRAIEQPLNILHNEFAVTVGMLNILLPFMILPIYSVLKNIDGNLIRAARNLGAGGFHVFVLVILPLSLPGVGTGVMFVFILSLGFFITPAILGGPRTLMISTLIDQQINRLMNWEFSAAIAVILLLATIIMVILLGKMVGLERMFGE